MRNLIGTLVLLLSIGLHGCDRSGDERGSVVEANKQLDKKLAEGFRSKNLDQIMSCWWNSPDVINIPADNAGVRKGYDLVRAAIKLQLDGIDRVLAFKFAEQDYMVFDDVVVGTGKIHFHVKPKGAPHPVLLTIFYTDLRQRRNGNWVYTYSHESLPPSPVEIAAGP